MDARSVTATTDPDKQWRCALCDASGYGLMLADRRDGLLEHYLAEHQEVPF